MDVVPPAVEAAAPAEQPPQEQPPAVQPEQEQPQQEEEPAAAPAADDAAATDAGAGGLKVEDEAGAPGEGVAAAAETNPGVAVPAVTAAAAAAPAAALNGAAAGTFRKLEVGCDYARRTVCGSCGFGVDPACIFHCVIVSCAHTHSPARWSSTWSSTG